MSLYDEFLRIFDLFFLNFTGGQSSFDLSLRGRVCSIILLGAVFFWLYIRGRVRLLLFWVQRLYIALFGTGSVNCTFWAQGPCIVLLVAGTV